MTSADPASPCPPHPRRRTQESSREEGGLERMEHVPRLRGITWQHLEEEARADIPRRGGHRARLARVREGPGAQGPRLRVNLPFSPSSTNLGRPQGWRDGAEPGLRLTSLPHTPLCTSLREQEDLQSC